MLLDRSSILLGRLPNVRFPISFPLHSPCVYNQGYWRGDVNRTIVQSCLLAAACKGGRGIVSHSSISTEHYLEDDRYCETGYVGPYCAICAKDFRRLSGYKCLDCQSDWGEAAHAVLWMATALAPVLLVSLIMYLVGGTNSFKQASNSFYVSPFCSVGQLMVRSDGRLVGRLVYWPLGWWVGRSVGRGKQSKIFASFSTISSVFFAAFRLSSSSAV